MMFITNNIFIDSSLLIEFIKGTKFNLLNNLIGQDPNSCFINETVVSEFLYYFLAINGNASPRSLQSSSKISSIFENFNSYKLLERFSFLSTSDKVFSLVPQLMKSYNFLPNDAIILATCKIHNITKLASYDTDFIIPCQAEGIELLREEE